MFVVVFSSLGKLFMVTHSGFVFQIHRFGLIMFMGSTLLHRSVMPGGGVSIGIANGKLTAGVSVRHDMKTAWLLVDAKVDDGRWHTVHLFRQSDVSYTCL